MRRSAFLLLALAAAPQALRAQSTAPAFHAGQWAGQFSVGYGFDGFGALHFSNPSQALALRAVFGASAHNPSGADNSSNSENLYLAIGRRTFKEGSGRVRPFHELGVNVSGGRSHQIAGPNNTTDLNYGAGVYGEIGATVFFAPELSLGATWEGNVGVGRQASYVNGNKTGSATNFGINVGEVFLEGAFYF